MKLTKKDQEKDKKLQPWKVFLSLVFLNIILGLVVYFFPKDGVQVKDGFSLNFVSVDELLNRKEKVEVDLSKVLEGVETIQEDTTNQPITSKDTIGKLKESKKTQKRKFSKWFSLPPDKPDMITNLLNKVRLESSKKVVRILHYGDSQLEGDRITNYLRNRLQKKFGGYGPGILLPLEPTATSRGNFRVNQSDNFVKHSIYTKSEFKNLSGIGGASFTIKNLNTNKGTNRQFGDSAQIVAKIKVSKLV